MIISVVRYISFAHICCIKFIVMFSSWKLEIYFYVKLANGTKQGHFHHFKSEQKRFLMRETKKGQNIQRISIKETQSEITFMRYDIALPQDKHDKLDCETASTVSFDKPRLLLTNSKHRRSSRSLLTRGSSPGLEMWWPAAYSLINIQVDLFISWHGRILFFICSAARRPSL